MLIQTLATSNAITVRRTEKLCACVCIYVVHCEKTSSWVVPGPKNLPSTQEGLDQRAESILNLDNVSEGIFPD